MVYFLDRVYASIINRNKFLEKIRYYAALRFHFRLITNIVIPVYFFLTRDNKRYCLENDSGKKERIIVSMTSFPTRIDKVWLVIETILRQTIKPDKIILWLSKDQFSSLDSLPQKLLKQTNR